MTIGISDKHGTEFGSLKFFVFSETKIGWEEGENKSKVEIGLKFSNFHVGLLFTCKETVSKFSIYLCWGG